MNGKLRGAFAVLLMAAAFGCRPVEPRPGQAGADAAKGNDSFFAVGPAAEVPTKVLPDRPLVCDLQSKPSYRQGERVEMTFKVTNQGEKPLWVLRWNTPLEGLMGDCFEIQHDEKVVTYLGRMVKRGMPEASEYILIPAGESREGRVDLRAAYQVEEPGTYSLHFDSLLFDVVDDESKLPRRLEDHEPFDPKCPPVVFEVR